MRLCLAVAFQQEAHWLRLHLPRLLEAKSVAGLVTLDGGSTDGSADVALALGGVVAERAFGWDFSAHLNALIEACEAAGYDAMLRLDPDELMWPEDVDHVAGSLERGAGALMWPTYHFERDRLHWMPQLYPDCHIRAWMLDRGVRYTGRLHEWPQPSQPCAIVKLEDVHLYHYEGIRTDARRRLKHLNYQRLLAGLEPLSELPPGQPEIGWRPYEVFERAQPLDPAVIGARAPFGEGA